MLWTGVVVLALVVVYGLVVRRWFAPSGGRSEMARRGAVVRIGAARSRPVVYAKR